jgi:hypothetical protein
MKESIQQAKAIKLKQKAADQNLFRQPERRCKKVNSKYKPLSPDGERGREWGEV